MTTNEQKANKKAYAAQWWITNREWRSPKQKAWRDANREYSRAKDKEIYWANVEMIRAKRNAKRRSKQGDAIRERERIYREANVVHIRLQHRQWEKEHPETRHKYIMANPEKLRSWDQRRKALKKAAPGKWTAEDLKLLHGKQHGLCAYCGHPYGQAFEVDHVIPLAKGGTNWPYNIVIACPRCNRSKGAKMTIKPLLAVGE